MAAKEPAKKAVVKKAAVKKPSRKVARTQDGNGSVGNVNDRKRGRGRDRGDSGDSS